LKKERATVDEVRGQLQKADSEVKRSLGQVSTLKTELDQVRATATALSQDYGKIRETSREAREDTTSALATAKDVENRLGPLARLLELTKSTDERFAALNALAEHVSHKGQGARKPATGSGTRRRTS
jgi:uncharacterized coiled-coil DUF342 family protein